MSFASFSALCRKRHIAGVMQYRNGDFNAPYRGRHPRKEIPEEMADVYNFAEHWREMGGPVLICRALQAWAYVGAWLCR